MVIIEKLFHSSNILDVIKKYKNPLIVTPGPREADNLRSQDKSYFFENKLDAITIANFIKQCLEIFCQKNIFPNEFKPVISKKSELFINLSGIWESVFGTEKNDLFFQAYTHLTDLRGSSLDLSLISEAFDHLDEDLKKAIVLFWKYLDSQGIVDEHRAYNIVAQNASYLNLENDAIVIIGFNHLSAIQVDMVNQLGEYLDVVIPLPRNALQKLSRFDWPTWLNSYEEGEKEVIHSTKKKGIIFNQNRLGETLNSIKGKKQKNINILLMKENIKYSDIVEIPFSGFDGRLNFSLFEQKIKNLFKKINREKINNVEELHQFLIQSAVQLISNQNKNPQNYAEIKIIQLVQKILKEMEVHFIGDTFHLSPFKMSILKNVCLLDAPRNSIVFYDLNLNNQNQLMGLSDVKFKSLEHIDIIIKKNDVPISFEIELGNRELMSFLSTIGPVKNSQLNRKINFGWLDLAIENAEATIFMEEGCEEIDPGIIEFFNIVNFDRPKLFVNQTALLSNPTYTDIGIISPSKLQNFIDCPKKFEESYLLKNKSYPKLKNNLLKNQLGIIQHQTIQYFYENQKKDTSIEEIYNITNELLHKFLIHHQIELSEIRFGEYLNEMTIACFNGVNFLKEISSLNLNYTFIFEEMIMIEDTYQGRPDLILLGENDFWVFDFKRSSSGIPRVEEVFSYNVIQLPFYAKIIKQKYHGKKIAGFGYINLLDIENNLILNFNDANENLINKMGAISLKLDELPFMNNFEQSLESTIVSLNQSYQQSKFLANPRKENACSYCPAKLFCRGNE